MRDHEFVGEIEFERRVYRIREGETVLAALLRGGADVASSCRKGSCHTCMLQVTEGDAPAASRARLSPELQAAGAFLPCVAECRGRVVAKRLDLSTTFRSFLVDQKELLSADVLRVRLEPPQDFTWRAGQSVQVRHPGGASRSFSIASSPTGYFVELHVRRRPGGAVSPWLFDEVASGDEVFLRGPTGTCTYDASMRGRPLVLVGTGTGGAMLRAILEDALAGGHAAPIRFCHGARTAEELYLRRELAEIAARHPNVDVRCAASRAEVDGKAAARITDVAFERDEDLAGAVLFLCGSPDMIYDARVAAIARGARHKDIHADPFEIGGQAWCPTPTDAEKLAATAPDPELWAALGDGALLNVILSEFYGIVYEDPRLLPYFRRVTKQRAIEKQYAFLRDVFAGTKDYFGTKPFNAHHWMVITDELFDYREELFFDCVRRHGFPERLIRRWAAFHEEFRREIVKSVERGMIIDGREQPLLGFEEEVLEAGGVCDGCEGEIVPNTTVRLWHRTGEVFCGACIARRLSALPPAGSHAPPEIPVAKPPSVI